MISWLSMASFCAVWILYVQRMAFSQGLLPMQEAFGWGQDSQGLLHVAFYVGYLAVQLSSGFLCRMFSGGKLCMVGLATSGVACSLIPVTGHCWPVILTVRCIMGAGQGVVYPGIMSLLGKFTPSGNISSVVNFVFSGGQAGTISVLLAYPLLIEFLRSAFDGDFYSWAVPFFIVGALGLVASSLWASKNVYTVKKEKIAAQDEDPPNKVDLLSENGQTKPCSVRCDSAPGKGPPSWSFLLRQRSVWALLVAYMAFNWTWTLIVSYLPKYLHYILGFPKDEQAFLSAIPFSVCWVFTVVFGVLSDILVARSVLCTRNVRRLFTAGGFAVCTVLLFGLVLVDIQMDAGPSPQSSRHISLILISCVISFSGMTKSGFAPNPLDLSPEYAGKLTGGCFFAVSLVGILSPMSASLLLGGGGCVDIQGREPVSCFFAWKTVFSVCALFNVFAAVFWILFGDTRALDIPKRPANTDLSSSPPSTTLSSINKT